MKIKVFGKRIEKSTYTSTKSTGILNANTANLNCNQTLAYSIVCMFLKKKLAWAKSEIPLNVHLPQEASLDSLTRVTFFT